MQVIKKKLRESSLLNNFKMKPKELIKEAVAGEITVGFELEIVVPAAKSLDSKLDDLVKKIIEQ